MLYLPYLSFLWMIVCKEVGFASENDSKSAIAGMKFSKLEKVTSSVSSVIHMEMDLYITNNILYSGGFTLKTTNGLGSDTLLGADMELAISKKTRVKDNNMFISGFTQVNRTHVIIADSHFNCLRVLNRDSNTLHTFAGRCQEFRGSDDLKQPWSVVLDKKRNKLLISDKIADGIASVDLKIEKLSTLILSDNLNEPSRLTLSPNDDTLFILNKFFLSSLDLITLQLKHITGTWSADYEDGDLQIAKFKNPMGMLILTPQLIFITEPNENRIRAVDLSSLKVSTICAKDSTSQFPCPDHPYSLLYRDGFLYVGQSRSISKMQFTLPLQETSTQNSTLHMPSSEDTLIKNTDLVIITVVLTGAIFLTIISVVIFKIKKWCTADPVSPYDTPETLVEEINHYSEIEEPCYALPGSANSKNRTMIGNTEILSSTLRTDNFEKNRPYKNRPLPEPPIAMEPETNYYSHVHTTGYAFNMESYSDFRPLEAAEINTDGNHQYAMNVQCVETGLRRNYSLDDNVPFSAVSLSYCSSVDLSGDNDSQ